VRCYFTNRETHCASVWDQNLIISSESTLVTAAFIYYSRCTRTVTNMMRWGYYSINCVLTELALIIKTTSNYIFFARRNSNVEREHVFILHGCDQHVLCLDPGHHVRGVIYCNVNSLNSAP